MKKVIGMFLVAAIGGFAAIAGYHYLIGTPAQTIVKEIVKTEPVRFANLPVSPSGEISDFTLAAEKTLNAVVHVKTEANVEPVFNPWADFFGGAQQDPYVQRGSGSGVIIDGSGYIVTNNHVIEGADKIEVSLNNNRSYEAILIGTDPSTDIALLKIEEKNLPTVSFGSSDALRIGEWVLAVGNPFDLTSTVTAGIVSAKARNINLLQYDPNNEIFPIESFIQTDAAVNPGNSGGALVNTRGELVGINTAIASRTGSYSGYSFAVPATIVEKVAKDLREFGGVQRAYIGVQITEVTQELAEEKGLDKIGGVLVTGLTENGAAAESGIESGDVIISVEGRAVNTVSQLQEQVGRYRPGDKLSVQVNRDGKQRDFAVKLRNGSGTTKLVKKEKKDLEDMLGGALVDLNEAEKQQFKLDHGVKITDLKEGLLKENGLSEGFIILRIDQVKVRSAEEARSILESKQGGVLVEGMDQYGRRKYIGLGLE